MDFSNLNTSQKHHYLICRNYSIALTIKCKELLTKAKMLNIIDTYNLRDLMWALSVARCRSRLFAWLLLRLKQPQQTWYLVMSKTQFNFDGFHANSRFAREFDEAAHSCFLKFCVNVHNAIHLHCSRELFFFFSVCLVFVFFFFKKLV